MEFGEFLTLTKRLVDDSGGRQWAGQPGAGFFKVYKQGSYFGECSMMRANCKMTAVLSSRDPNKPVALMILDKATYQVSNKALLPPGAPLFIVARRVWCIIKQQLPLMQAIMEGSFEEYVASRVQFLQLHCSMFRDLHPLSNIECLSFAVDVEYAGDEEYIIKQGAPAQDVVVIVDGCCKVSLR